jgi:hypothetical protein
MAGAPSEDTGGTACESCDDNGGSGGSSSTDSGGASGSTDRGGNGGDAGDGGDPGPVLPGGSSGIDPGEDGPETKGELVVVAFDGGTRNVGHQRIVIHGGRVFWTRDQDDSLGIFSASLSGPLPAEPETLLQAEWYPSSGWNDPPILVTGTHLILPIIGTIDAGNGFIDTDGWATLRRDGSELELDRFDDWWLAAHGANVIMPADPAAEEQLPQEINLATGAATPVPDFVGSEECAYDAIADEQACLWYGQLNAYSFATHTGKLIVESPSIQYGGSGTPRIAFNSSHWFVGHALGLAAYPREGGGSPTYYRSIDARAEAFAVDEQFAFLCIDNDMVRVSLADETREALTQNDCASNSRLGAVLGMDATYIYYLGVREISYGAQPVDILRIRRNAPGTPQPVPSD